MGKETGGKEGEGREGRGRTTCIPHFLKALCACASVGNPTLPAQCFSFAVEKIHNKTWSGDLFELLSASESQRMIVRAL